MKRFKARQIYLLLVLILCVFSIPGCGGGGGQVTEHWAPNPNPDTTAPTVTAVVPLNKATGVARNLKKVTAAFSEAMDSATLTTASFTLSCPGGTTTGGGAVTYVATGRVATLPLPAATNLPANTLCTATVTTGAKDVAGNPLAAQFTWTFTTGLLVDSTAPTVTLTVPVAAATGVARNTKITATFNEDMDPLTIDGTTFTVVNTTLGGTAVAGDVTYSVAAKTATFTPTTPATLPASTLFTATITAGAKDLAGNALVVPAGAGLKPNPWTFTTGTTTDVTLPTVTLVSPVNLSTTVCNNKTISATFDKDMDALTITTATFTLAKTATPGTLVAGVVLYDAASKIATFDPDADLTGVPVTSYTATIKGGAGGVTDVASNAMAVDKVWSFTTDNTTCIAQPALGTASTFGISATAGVTNTATAPNTNIHGDVVLDPTATCNAVALDAAGGFGLCGGMAPTIAGTVISSLYDPGGDLATIKADLKAAFLSITPPAGPPAAGSMGAPTYTPTNLPAGTTLGDVTGSALVQGDNYFVAGLYQTTTSLLITGDLTLDAQGDPNAVFVFQSSSTVGTAAGAAGGVAGTFTRILLTGGAKASNVWWQAGTSATLGLYSEFQGNILASESITMKTGATSCGRLMAGAFAAGAFVFDSNVVSVPGQPFAPPAGYSTTCQ